MRKRLSLVLALVLAAAYVTYGVLLAFLSQVGFPTALQTSQRWPFLCDKPVGEDGFYMLTIASRIAEGHGFTYNFGKVTTGVQPLVTLLYAGIATVLRALGYDRWALVRTVLLLGVLTGLVNAWLFSRIAGRLASGSDEQRAAASQVAWILALCNAWLFRSHTYGLETGFYMLLVTAAFWYTLVLPKHPRPTQYCLLGAIAGAAALARVDFGVVLAVLLAACVVTRRFSLSGALLTGATAAGFLLPWILWVHQASGHWLQSSGRAQAHLVTWPLATDRLWNELSALAQNLLPWIFTGGKPVLVVTAWALLVAMVLVVRPRSRGPSMEPDKRAWILLWSIAISPLVLIYPVFFWATHFYGRYLIGVQIIALPTIACSVAATFHSDRFRLLLATVLGAIFAATVLVFFHRGNIGNSHTVTAGVVEAYYGPPHRVGAFQSGVVGYFNPNVINLDGKIDEAALEHLRHGRMAEYVDSANIDILVDWQSVFSSFAPSYLKEHWTACEVGIPNGASLCYQRRER